MKYIDAEKLKEKIQSHYENAKNRARYAAQTGTPSDCVRWDEAKSTYGFILYLIESLQQEQPVLPGIEVPGIPGKDFIPVEWVDACEKYGKWKIVKVEQPEVDLENYISNKLRELGADLINHKPYSFNRGLNVGKTKAYEDILGRLNTRKEE